LRENAEAETDLSCGPFTGRERKGGKDFRERGEREQ